MITKNWYEISGAIIGGNTPGIGSHTAEPLMVEADNFSSTLEKIFGSKNINAEKYFREQTQNSLNNAVTLRNNLLKIIDKIKAIVGSDNVSLAWLDREAHATDSMEHRAFIPEAIIFACEVKALQQVVELLYQHKIPMVPYGEGGGYNMGVVPMAPAVTISVRGIAHLSKITQSPRDPNKYAITVGAGLPFKTLLAHLTTLGFVLRCNPNTPRAATGGIAATGSNAGKKAFEVILGGRAIGAFGKTSTFSVNAYENNLIATEPFLLTNKFFSIPNANYLDNTKELPISAFVGAEGTTGIIYEVTFEIEKELSHLIACRLQFNTTNAALFFTSAVKKLESNNYVTYFEFLSGTSIKKYLSDTFADVFCDNTQACLILALEANNAEQCSAAFSYVQTIINNQINNGDIIKSEITEVLNKTNSLQQFEYLIKPREELPKKLRTKCKTDLEIRSDFLEQALRIIAEDTSSDVDINKQDILFGHLTPAHTAILHWNIGGINLYDEESSESAWAYLQQIYAKIRTLSDIPNYAAAFSGEHGIAGKAPFLWLNYLAPEEFTRLCAIKDKLDPYNLFNPETIFLKTPYARALRARLLPLTNPALNLNPIENAIIKNALDCTRCNSCKVCPVEDAIFKLKAKKEIHSTLPLKRDIILFLERVVMLKRPDITAQWVTESANRLKYCFYCRRCDTNCPVNIELKPLVSSYYNIANLVSKESFFWKNFYNVLLNPWPWQKLTFKVLALTGRLSTKPLARLRKLNMPMWLKTYLVFPRFAFTAYKTTKVNPVSKNNTLYIRFKGCLDTFASPQASEAVDWLFSNILQTPFTDLPKDLCCGFPFEADGCTTQATACKTRISREIIKIQQSMPANTNIVIFSSCPTCVHMLQNINLNKAITIQDTISLAYSMLPSISPLKIINKTIGLKVPCHNPDATTTAQHKFLQYFFKNVVLFHNCCGLSGSGRLKHPRIGTQIAQDLFEEIRNNQVCDILTSGCPSCRDGVYMQANIEQETVNYPFINNIMGICEAIQAFSEIPTRS